LVVPTYVRRRGTGSEIPVYWMRATKARERWLVTYCALALDLPGRVLDALFPTPDWEVWSKFFHEEIERMFWRWMRADGGPRAMGPGMSLWRQHTFVMEITLGMKADKNMTFVLGPLLEDTALDMWCLYLEHGRIWIGVPGGKKHRILRMGTELRLKAAVKGMRKRARVYLKMT
jgi:hypothetical protein